VATPYHALVRIARLEAGETLAVLGVGGLGSNAVQLGKLLGARVVAVSRSEAKLELARSLGADEVVQASGRDTVERARLAAGGPGPDVVIQCVGSAEVDEQAIASPASRAASSSSARHRSRSAPAPSSSAGRS
jgi:D-arabinose 1-dehydrogenase-like Zn-dependent alcohol dehydrogenase